jgi:hypothetical protein
MQVTSSTSRSRDIIVFGFFLSLVLIYRWLILKDFSFQICDSDQAILWQGLKDYSEGRFYEPRFYGQAYNSFFEALLAVPLYKAGLAAHLALPIVSSSLSLLPFILLSYLCYFKRSKLIGLLVLCLPLLLPVEHAMLTSMPRGFVPGIALAGVACFQIFYKHSRTAFALGAFLHLLAFSLNSNAILISVPCLFYLWLENRKNVKFYRYTALGALPAALIHGGAALFYIRHPNYNLHRFGLEYSFSDLWAAMRHLDDFFNFNAPVTSSSGFLVLIYFLLIAFYYFKKGARKEALVTAFIPFLILFTFGFNKVNEGTSSLFFHYSRMFLAVPVLLAFSAFLHPPVLSRKIHALLLLVPLYFFVEHILTYPLIIQKRSQPGNEERVIIARTETILSDCKNLHYLCDALKVELFVISNHFYYDYYNYGCATCVEDFPKTLRPVYERRTYRLVEDEKCVYKTILIIDMKRALDKEFAFVKKIPNHPDLYLINNNSVYTMDLLKKLNIPCRIY